MSNSEFKDLIKPTDAQIEAAHEFMLQNTWIAPVLCEYLRDELILVASADARNKRQAQEEFCEELDVTLSEATGWDLNE